MWHLMVVLFSTAVPLAILAAVVWIGFEVRAIRRLGSRHRETQVGGDRGTDR